MTFKYRVFKKRDVIPTLWDGGKTYEYVVYPLGSSYSDRNFLFRISSASIDKIPSNFTRFKNYQRFLVMLDNNLKVIRNGLEEYYSERDVFAFDSEDSIVSFSLGNDFNLMIQKNIKSVQVVFLEKSISLSHSLLFFFSKSDTLLKINDSLLELAVDDLLVIENNNRESIDFLTEKRIIMGYFCL